MDLTSTKIISKKYLVSILYIDAYMWHLKNGTDEPISKSGGETDVENGLVDPGEEGEYGNN